MEEVFEKQYALLKDSRKIVLDFVETQVGRDLNTPVPAYCNNTINNLLEHTAQCYFHWLAYFALDQPQGSLTELDFTTLEMIRRQYGRVDEVMATFLGNFAGKMENPIDGMHSRNGRVIATPLQVFTHVLTHEFHHKGQIMSMCRLLGHIPPETDLSLFF